MDEKFLLESRFCYISQEYLRDKENQELDLKNIQRKIDSAKLDR
jgi:hypothetical protein